MTALIRIGKLLMTPEQLRRALDEDMTVSQVERMIVEDRSKARIPHRVTREKVKP